MGTSTSMTIPTHSLIKCVAYGHTGDTNYVEFQIGDQSVQVSGTGEGDLKDANGNSEVEFNSSNNSSLTITFWSSNNPDPFVRSMAPVPMRQTVSWMCASMKTLHDDQNPYSTSMSTWPMKPSV